MDRLGQTFKHLDSFALGVALGVLSLAVPDVVADLVRVTDPGSFGALLERLWNVFSRSILPMSIGGAVGLWIQQRNNELSHERTFWRSILSGFGTAALLVALDRIGGFNQIGISDVVRIPILAGSGMFGALLAHVRLSRPEAMRSRAR